MEVNGAFRGTSDGVINRAWLKSFLVPLCWLLIALGPTQNSLGIDATWEYSVQVSATIQTSPPKIILTWPQDGNGIPQSYTVYRKGIEDTDWGAGTILPGQATSYVDSSVNEGAAYEYQIVKKQSTYSGYGYIYAGVNAQLVESRGKIILVVDNTFSTSLETELTRLQRDMVGDGWTVVRRDVSRSNSVSR